MPFILKFESSKPSIQNPQSVLDWLSTWADNVYKALRGLIYLDAGVREVRSLNAETANLFLSAVVGTTAVVTRMRDLAPQVQDKIFTTALIMFDGAAGAGRFRVDGGDPTPLSATAAAGMPIAQGGGTLVITGQQNIARFAVAAETATTLNMSVTLYQ